jgi:hypothetical protein
MRIRSLKPGFFSSQDVCVLPFRARLTWQGLWCYADDHGRGKADVRLIKAAVWPLDDEVTIAEVEEDLAILAAHGRIVRYTVDGRDYLAIANWHHHGHINRPTATAIPAPPRPVSVPAPDARGHCPDCWEDLVHTHQGDDRTAPPAAAVDNSTGDNTAGQTDHAGLRESSVSPPAPLTPVMGIGEMERGEGTRAGAREETPSPHCLRHPGGTDEPCIGCRNARLAHETWIAQAGQRDLARRRGQVHAAAQARAAAIRACGMCDERGYTGGALCNHDPTLAETAARGMALVRAALPTRSAVSA